MSYRIDYKRKAYQYQDAYGQCGFVVLAEAGDNNVWEMNNRRRARRWGVLFHGAEYAVYQDIASYCGRVSGGGLQLIGHRRTGDYAKDITSAIRLYDRLLKNARPLEELFKAYVVRGEVTVQQDVPVGYAKEQLAAYLAKYHLTLEPVNDYGESVQRASFNLSEESQLLETLRGGWGDSNIRLRVLLR